MIVVDTNILAYLYINSDLSSRAAAAFRRDPDWAAPLLWRSEFRNVLALYLRQERLSLVEARQIMDDVTELMMDWEYEVTSYDVLHLVAQSSCTAYDCEFVALAEQLGIPLVTGDKQLINAFPDIAVSLEDFARS